MKYLMHYIPCHIFYDIEKLNCFFNFFCSIFFLHFRLLPFSVDFLIGEFCGMSTAMESFQGHGIKPKSKELQTKIEENENS